MKKRLIALLMCALMILGSMACSSGETSQNDSSTAETSQAQEQSTADSAGDASQAEDSQAEAEVGGEATYPLSDEPVQLSYYIRINGAMSATMETYADVEFFKYLEELTNVQIQ